MLPTGHVAAGYLTAYALLKVTNPAVTPDQADQLLWWGMFFGFAPDIDVFWFFFKNKALLVSPKNAGTTHRFYASHAPILWLLAGLLIAVVARDPYWRTVGLLFWLGSWSHLLLDTIEYGVMWLWPKRKLYALIGAQEKLAIEEKNVVKHSWQFLKLYSRKASFYLEAVVIIVALYVYFS